MNVTIENLAPCKKLMRVEVEAQKVDETFDSVTKELQRKTTLPGFRPGKAPRDVLMRKYGKHIEDQVRRKLIADSYRQAVEDRKLEVLGNPDIEEIQFTRGQPLQFAATLETAPEFELPNYRELVVNVPVQAVSEADFQQAIDVLRDKQAVVVTVDRPLQTGDFAVVNYLGTIEGKPLTEFAPTAKGLTEKQAFWVEAIPANGFIPGFAEQLLGAKAGERRTVTVNFPADFVTPQLAGKQAVYEVELLEVKQKTLPSVDDSLAKAFGAENVEALKAGVREDLSKELKFQQTKAVRNQIMRWLIERTTFDLPESELAKQTRNVTYEIVNQNAKRGITREIIERERDNIAAAAAQGAQERVKLSFILQKVAEKEDLKVSQEEIAERINHLANLYQIPAQDFLKDLQKRNGMIEIFDQVMADKVVQFLLNAVKIQEIPALPGSDVNPS